MQALLFVRTILWLIAGGIAIAFAFYFVIKTLEPWVTKLLNKIWLPSVIPYPLAPDEELQLVVDKNLISTATWATISASFKLAMAGFFCGALVVGIEFGYRLYSLTMQGLIGESVQDFNLSYFPLGFVIPFLFLPFVYWLRAWREKATRLIVTNRALIFLNTNIPILGVDFQVSQGSVVIAKEILAGTDVDKLLKSNPALAKKHPDLANLTGGVQDLFNRMLAKRYGTGVLVIPSAMQFATDIFEAADYAVSTSFIVRQIAVESENAGLGGSFLLAATNLSRTDLEAAAGSVETEFIDLLAVQDPGVWNRRTGQKVDGTFADAEPQVSPWRDF